MAGVINKCKHCNATLYDAETAMKRCNYCGKADWNSWRSPTNTKHIKIGPEPCGYHLKDIPQGEAGELSKLLEEIHEAIDAEEQDNPIMVLAELSDLYGAMVCYLEKHLPTFTMEHISNMSEATHRAFKSGRRNRKEKTP
jgi:hypothetical protein